MLLTRIMQVICSHISLWTRGCLRLLRRACVLSLHLTFPRTIQRNKCGSWKTNYYFYDRDLSTAFKKNSNGIKIDISLMGKCASISFLQILVENAFRMISIFGRLTKSKFKSPNPQTSSCAVSSANYVRRTNCPARIQSAPKRRKKTEERSREGWRGRIWSLGVWRPWRRRHRESSSWSRQRWRMRRRWGDRMVSKLLSAVLFVHHRSLPMPLFLFTSRFWMSPPPAMPSRGSTGVDNEYDRHDPRVLVLLSLVLNDGVRR